MTYEFVNQALDPEVKAAWVAALRSGEYKQGYTFLHNFDNGTMCCLGVLCELDGTAPRQVTSDSSGTFYVFGWEKSHGQLPDELQRKFDMDSLGTFIEHDGPRGGRGTVTLAMLNDEGFTFDQIADVIDYCF